MLMAEESMVREEVGKATAVAVREMVVVEMAKGALVMVTAVVVKAWVATDLAVASKVLGWTDRYFVQAGLYRKLLLCTAQ